MWYLPSSLRSELYLIGGYCRALKWGGKRPCVFSCPRGMPDFRIDNAGPFQIEAFKPDKTYVTSFTSAWRSALNAKLAQDMWFDSVAHVKGGFAAEVQAGGQVEEGDQAASIAALCSAM